MDQGGIAAANERRMKADGTQDVTWRSVCARQVNGAVVFSLTSSCGAALRFRMPAESAWLFHKALGISLGVECETGAAPAATSGPDVATEAARLHAIERRVAALEAIEHERATRDAARAAKLKAENDRREYGDAFGAGAPVRVAVRPASGDL